MITIYFHDDTELMNDKIKLFFNMEIVSNGYTH